MPACIYHTQDYLLAPVQIGVLLNDSVLLAALVSTQVEQFPSCFYRRFCKKALSLPLPIYGLPMFLTVSYLSSP